MDGVDAINETYLLISSTKISTGVATELIGSRDMEMGMAPDLADMGFHNIIHSMAALTVDTTNTSSGKLSRKYLCLSRLTYLWPYDYDYGSVGMISEAFAASSATMPPAKLAPSQNPTCWKRTIPTCLLSWMLLPSKRTDSSSARDILVF